MLQQPERHRRKTPHYDLETTRRQPHEHTPHRRNHEGVGRHDTRPPRGRQGRRRFHRRHLRRRAPRKQDNRLSLLRYPRPRQRLLRPRCHYQSNREEAQLRRLRLLHPLPPHRRAQNTPRNPPRKGDRRPRLRNHDTAARQGLRPHGIRRPHHPPARTPLLLAVGLQGRPRVAPRHRRRPPLMGRRHSRLRQKPHKQHKQHK